MVKIESAVYYPCKERGQPRGIKHQRGLRLRLVFKKRLCLFDKLNRCGSTGQYYMGNKELSFQDRSANITIDLYALS
jgi:hypothetical protein